MAAITICSDFGAQKNKINHCFPIYLPWSDGTRCHDLSVFWMLSFKPTFSLSTCTFKRLFSSSLSAVRVVSSAYLRLLIFLLAILIPVCASSSSTFCVMYSAYKLNKQGDNIQPWCTLFPTFNQSTVPCPVLTVASWPAYRFHRKPVLELEPMRPGLKASQNPQSSFQLRSHTWFQNVMNLSFSLSHHRKNSLRNKVIGKKLIYLERNTPHR